MGCGFKRMEDFINVDLKSSQATDILADCSELKIFPDQSVDLIFSNAFFEHLYYDERLNHLKNVYRVLQKNGVAVYLGIPDFEAIAKAYLKGEQGNVSPKFDLDEVYRYTHGQPEQVPTQYWREQLHKTLFDMKTLKVLLSTAGFKTVRIFRYRYQNDRVPVALGFIAFKGKPRDKFSTSAILKQCHFS